MTGIAAAIPAARRRSRARTTFPVGLHLIDRYLIGRTFGPMLAVLGSTMLAFLMERILRSLDLLAQTSNGFGYLVGLIVNLAPHYMGLTLPAGFFIALLIVVGRLNEQSEIDVMLAGGMSLGRVAAPFVALGLVMMVLSLILYGFVQPYSRYGYRAVLHAARDAGWNGEVKPWAFLSPDNRFLLTVDEVDAADGKLKRVFIRRLEASGGEEVLTASSADLHRSRGGQGATLELRDGQQLISPPGGGAYLLTFSRMTLRLPLAPAARLLRTRGHGEETELTLFELAGLGFGDRPTLIPPQALLAELYSRLARAIALPLMPLLAIPLGLTAKRAGPGAGFAMAGLFLFAFQASLVFGQGLASEGVVLAAHAAGWPFAVFAGICVLTFAVSRDRPGENPINWLAEHLSDVIRAVAARRPWRSAR